MRGWPAPPPFWVLWLGLRDNLFNRIGLYLLPVLAVAVLASTLLIAGAPRPFLSARVYGGPVRGVSRMSFQVAAFEYIGGVERRLNGERLVAKLTFADSETKTEALQLDRLGEGSVAFAKNEINELKVSFSVDKPGVAEPLASGSLDLSSEDWSGRASRRGGWLRTPEQGELRVRLAVERGVAVVPFATHLVVDVSEPKTEPPRPVSGARVEVRGRGLSVKKGSTPEFTNDKGRCISTVQPLEHVVDIEVRASLADGRSGIARGVLPVQAGAFNIELSGDELRVQAPVQRERAYLALVSLRERVWGTGLDLRPDARGGSVGTVRLPPLGGQQAWLVASSQIGLSSPARVGFPLHVPEGSWASTFTVSDQLLLDGTQAGLSRNLRRTRRIQALTVSIVLLALTLTVLLLLDRVRTAERRLTRHLSASGMPLKRQEALMSDNAWFRVGIAVALITLGFLIVALVSMLRLG